MWTRKKKKKETTKQSLILCLTSFDMNTEFLGTGGRNNSVIKSNYAWDVLSAPCCMCDPKVKEMRLAFVYG